MNENLSYLAAHEDVEFPAGAIKIEVTKEKPFNQCFTCDYFRNGCSGPNLNVMSAERVCEFLQVCRITLRYTYQKTADLSGLSLVTVKRTLTGKNKDPGYATIQALSSVLAADPNGKYPCALHIVGDQSEAAKQECERLQIALDAVKIDRAAEVAAFRANEEYFKKQIDFAENELRTKDAQQEELYEFVRRKNRVIGMLSFALALCVIAVIGVLLL